MTVLDLYWETPGDLLAFTSAPGRALVPPGITALTEGAAQRQIAVLVQLRNAEGDVVGVCSELEIVRPDKSLEVHLTVLLPDRGSLLVHQTKTYPSFLADHSDAARAGTRWTGEETCTLTDGPYEGMGRVIGGTGEFADMTGVHAQKVTFRRLGPEGLVATCHEHFELRQG